MKVKTINKVLKNLHAAWLKTIKDETVASLIKEDTIITGGCIASMLLKEPINDFDVYFRTESTALAVAQYYCDQFVKENGLKPFKVEINEVGNINLGVRNVGTVGHKPQFENQDDFETADPFETDENAIAEPSEKKEKFRPVFISPNAITLSDKIQVMFRFHGDPADIHKNFDFIHCTNYWVSSDGGELFLNQPALEAILARELFYVGSLFPVCSIIRLRKFIKRGWSVNAGQILKIIFQIQELDLMDIKVLEDQLVGVDTLYFVNLIESIQKENPENIDRGFISNLIDDIF